MAADHTGDMTLTLLTAMLLAQGGATATESGPNPNALPIGTKGSVEVKPAEIVSTRSGKAVTVEEIARSCEKSKYLFLGENHATKAHQDLQAQLIAALVKAGRHPIVGLEMFQRPKQDVLDQWSAGQLTEEQFILQSDWKTQWGYGYEFYRPVFEVVKSNKIPLVGLNVPRDWVRTTGKTGFDTLPTSARLQLPGELDTTNKNHRSVFDALMGGHSMAGASMDRMYAAQVLWDEGMADTAMKYYQVRPPKPEDIFVIIAGSGHVMYGQGINYRIQKRSGGRGPVVVMTQSNEPISVSKGLGDWVFVSRPPAK